MIKINIINNYNNLLTYKSNQIKNLISFVFNKEKCKKAFVTIVLTNKNHLSKLKKEFFNLNQYTDVIAFNLEDDNSPIDGEIYISIDDVIENSKIYSVTFNEEFKRVIIHGILHLIGYEDENSKQNKKMHNLENKYLLNCTTEIIKLKC